MVSDRLSVFSLGNLECLNKLDVEWRSMAAFRPPLATENRCGTAGTNPMRLILTRGKVPKRG